MTTDATRTLDLGIEPGTFNAAYPTMFLQNNNNNNNNPADYIYGLTRGGLGDQ